jgi:hypothetical protein
MEAFDLSTVLTPDVSVVEVFVLPQRPSHGDDNDAIRVGWMGEKMPSIPSFWNVVQKATLRNYSHRDMSYSYDIGSDGQRCVRQTWINDHFVDDNFYAVGFQEDVLPCHRFPSTREIVNDTKIIRNVYRMNNRICLYHDFHEAENISYVYFRYQHSENVDIPKMNQDLNNAMRKLMRRG